MSAFASASACVCSANCASNANLASLAFFKSKRALARVSFTPFKLTSLPFNNSVRTSCLRSNSFASARLNSFPSNSRKTCAMQAPCSFARCARSSFVRGRSVAMLTYHSFSWGCISQCGAGLDVSNLNAPAPAGAPPRDVHTKPPVLPLDVRLGILLFSEDDDVDVSFDSGTDPPDTRALEISPCTFIASVRYSTEVKTVCFLVASPPTPARRVSRSSSLVYPFLVSSSKNPRTLPAPGGTTISSYVTAR
mmetsp:Transcript_6602/g.22225  ORF Transcript_6602/g.22225 Transcript_6602/m.22225 type:complete len:250 (-) Transcript_6602:513-1262(-)